MDLSLKRHYGQKGEHRGRFGPSNCSSQSATIINDGAGFEQLT
jgi:hypothetical protein